MYREIYTNAGKPGLHRYRALRIKGVGGQGGDSCIGDAVLTSKERVTPRAKWHWAIYTEQDGESAG